MVENILSIPKQDIINNGGIGKELIKTEFQTNLRMYKKLIKSICWHQNWVYKNIGSLLVLIIKVQNVPMQKVLSLCYCRS